MQADFCHWHSPETTLLFAQLIISDFRYGLDLYLWHLRTCLPFSMAWHSPLKLQVLSFSFCVCVCFLALQSYFIYGYPAPRCLFTRLTPSFPLLNFAYKSTWPSSSKKKKKKRNQKCNQQPCLSVDSIQN